jgi:hypothetical protein
MPAKKWLSRPVVGHKSLLRAATQAAQSRHTSIPLRSVAS